MTGFVQTVINAANLLPATLGLVLLAAAPRSVYAQSLPSDLTRVTSDETKTVNALWIENPLDLQFKSTNRVVVANIEGPAEITMMHFALPGAGKLNRDLLLRIYWDGETNLSVDCPLVDFFCDPDGTRDVVDSAMVNVCRGFNCYFPMPFRKSAKVELQYDGPVEPRADLWRKNPCYSYVSYHTLGKFPKDTGYFCASWKQDTLKLGLKDYVALETRGKGKFIGWNVTVRGPGRRYPVDENEKFYIDGKTSPSIEFQGLEDSFGFSWGFPPTEKMFPLTGWFPFMRGAAAYRFFLPDAIGFRKSLKVAIGFGEHEGAMWRRIYSGFGSSLQFSSTVYWYQIGSRAPLPPMPPAAERAAAPEQIYWPEVLKMPSVADYTAGGVKLVLFCGYPGGEVIYSEPGYSISWNTNAISQRGQNWGGEVFYCRANQKEFGFDLKLPKGNKGILRLYIIDPDETGGGRKETIIVGGETIGTFEHFEDGRWVEVPVGPDKTPDGTLSVQIVNALEHANAVLSKVEWLEKQ
jgi:hypothetical protein